MAEPAVLLTGATGKLGRAFALGFSALGYEVAFTTRRADAGDALRRECENGGAARTLCIEVDLSAPDAVAKVVAQLARADISPQVLVNNARDLANLHLAEDGQVTRSGWQGEFSLGVVIPYELTLALAAAQPRHLSSVINIASIYGITAQNVRLYDPPSGQVPPNYGVVKAALIHLTKDLAIRLAPDIRVNAVSYGGVDGRVDDAFRDRYSRLCPAGRMLDISEVFGAVKYLASSESRGMTGHNMVIDGGWTIW